MRGKTVAILESRLGPQMVALIEKRGGACVHAPALAELPDVDASAVARLMDDVRAHPPKLAIFQTGVGTRALFATTDALGVTEPWLASLAAMTVVVRGPKPTAALRSRNVRIDLAAADPFTTHEVLQALVEISLADTRVIVQRYGVTNVELDEALRSRGAHVEEIPTYRWAIPADTAPLIALMDALDAHRVDAVAVTNAAQVHNLFAVADSLGRGESLRAALDRTLIASIGPVASVALRRFRVGVALEASPPKLGPLIDALDAALSQTPPVAPHGASAAR